MRAWLYLLAAAIAGAVVTVPAIVALVAGGSFDDALFAALATLALVSALAVVTMRDIIRCGLAMIVSFLSLAGIYVIAGAPLIAAAQVIVYVGAISVLILFAVMLTQSKAAPAQLVFQTQAAAAGVAAAGLFVIIGLAVVATDWGALEERVRLGTQAMAKLLFSEYVLPFEIVSVLLLAAVVGGVFIAKKEDRG